MEEVNEEVRIMKIQSQTLGLLEKVIGHTSKLMEIMTILWVQ